jgi:plastocyanin
MVWEDFVVFVRFAGCIAGGLCLVVASCGGEVNRPAPQSQAPEPAPQAVTSTGRLTGTISVSGEIPSLPRRPINKDTKVCGTGARPSEELVVARSGGLKNALVFVDGIRGGKPMPPTKPVIDQSGCEYVPHVQVMPVNTELSIVNSDPLLHNIHVYQGDADLFNVAQPTKGQTNTHRIDRAGFIYAECDVHGWMRGHIAVVDNPYYAITDEQGQFRIDALPPGTYTARIWHEYLGERTQQVNVIANTDATMTVDLRDALLKKIPSKTPVVPKPTAAPQAAANVLSGEVTVNMVSHGGTFAYEPGNITVKAGTTVKWVNTSENRHTATDDPKFEKTPGQAILPAGATAWSTPFIANGQDTSYTFTTPGKYQYFCRNHGQFGMVATITVVP